MKPSRMSHVRLCVGPSAVTAALGGSGSRPAMRLNAPESTLRATIPTTSTVSRSVQPNACSSATWSSVMVVGFE